jgi:hypothetical protein
MLSFNLVLKKRTKIRTYFFRTVIDLTDEFKTTEFSRGGF